MEVDSLSQPTEPEVRPSSTKVDLLHPAAQFDTPQAPVAAVPVAPPTPPPPPPPPTPVPPATLPQSLPPLPPPPPRRGWLVGVIAFLVVVLAIGGGIGYWWYTTQREPAAEEPTSTQPASITSSKPTNLQQFTDDGKSIATGGATGKPSVLLSFRQPSGVNFAPEVEVVPVGMPFTGKPSAAEIKQATGDNTLAISVSGLADGKYHWQARFKQGEEFSSWVSYGGNEETAADFVVDTAAPAAPVLANLGGKAPSSGTTTVTSNRPSFTGTAEPGSVVKLDVSPGPLSLNVTADTSGNWTVTPQADIPNGNQTVTIIATDPAGNTSKVASYKIAINAAQADSTAPPTTAPTPTPAALAPTGDPAWPMLLAGLSLLAISLAGLLVRRSRA